MQVKVGFFVLQHVRLIDLYYIIYVIDIYILQHYIYIYIYYTYNKTTYVGSDQ